MSELSPSGIALFVGVVILCVALAFVVRQLFFGYPKRSVEPSSLSAREQAIIAACADALFPSGGPIPLSGTEAGLVAYMDGYLGRFSRRSRLLTRMLFLFIEHSPWIFGPRPARFTRLRPEERIEALDRMAHSRIYFRRVAFLSLRAMLTMGYLANDDVAKQLGCMPCATPFERAELTKSSTPRGRREVFA